MIEIDDDTVPGVRTIVLNRPEKANSLPQASKAELAEAIASASDAKAQAVLIRGQGSQNFCAGSDVSEMSTFDSSQMFAMLSDERAMYLAAIRSPLPVIAAVNGHAMGAGLNLVLSCDYVISANSATFGAPEVTIGVADPLEGLLLPLVIGLGHARRLYFRGERLDASEARGLGVVHDLATSDELLGRASETALDMARLPGSGFRVQKHLLAEWVEGVQLGPLITASHYATAWQFASGDVQESLAGSRSRQQ